MRPRPSTSRPVTSVISLILSCALLATLMTAIYAGKAGASQGGQSRRVKPEPPRAGAPEGTLPNLGEVRTRPSLAPRAPAPVPSKLRSRRKPLEPRRGRKVGDPLPPPAKRAAAVGSGEEPYAVSSGELHAFNPVRFLVSPSDDQFRTPAGSFSFFSPTAFDGLGLSLAPYAAAAALTERAGGLSGVGRLLGRAGSEELVLPRLDGRAVVLHRALRPVAGV